MLGGLGLAFILPLTVLLGKVKFLSWPMLGRV